jgi:hypothetical protein
VLVGVEEGVELAGGFLGGVDGDRLALRDGPQSDIATSVEVLIAGRIVGVMHEAPVPGKGSGALRSYARKDPHPRANAFASEVPRAKCHILHSATP